MPTDSVGKPYNPAKTSWPDGAAQLSFRRGELELLLFWGAPSQDEVAAVARGRANFGVLVEDGLILGLGSRRARAHLVVLPILIN